MGSKGNVLRGVPVVAASVNPVSQIKGRDISGSISIVQGPKQARGEHS